MGLVDTGDGDVDGGSRLSANYDRPWLSRVATGQRRGGLTLQGISER